MDDFQKLIDKLTFRPERSRPVWRNKHTGRTAVVTDLDVNDYGGFQGGCLQFVVVTNEKPPPGPPNPPDYRARGPHGHNVHSLTNWLKNWEPTGDHVNWPVDPDVWIEPFGPDIGGYGGES